MTRNISFIRVFVVTENTYLYLGIRELIERTRCFHSCLYTITQSDCMPETVAYSKSRTFDIIISDNYYFRITASQQKIKNTLTLPADYDLLTYLKCFDSLHDDSKISPEKVIKKLSLKENLLFSLLSSGLRDDNISTALHISKKTVSAHRRNILGKLKLKNRNELYLFALASRGEVK
jgi:DNA-binding CsgD family transcriptional regulator